MNDNGPFPYRYGTDLHWLWGWGNRLDLWLQQPHENNRMLRMIFRADRQASDAMLRLSSEHPEIVERVKAAENETEDAYRGFDGSEAAIEKLGEAMTWLRDEIFSAARAIYEAETHRIKPTTTATQREPLTDTETELLEHIPAESSGEGMYAKELARLTNRHLETVKRLLTPANKLARHYGVKNISGRGYIKPG